jgi:hypothetical protein
MCVHPPDHRSAEFPNAHPAENGEAAGARWETVGFGIPITRENINPERWRGPQPTLTPGGAFGNDGD